MQSTAGWLRAGGLYDHAEIENTAGDIVADSGHEFGWEAGAGLSVPIGERLALAPGVRYRTFSANVDVGEGTTSVDLTYVAVEVGLSWSFGGNAVTTAIKR